MTSVIDLSARVSYIVISFGNKVMSIEGFMGDTTITGNGNVVGDHNIVTVIYQGVPVFIPSSDAISGAQSSAAPMAGGPGTGPLGWMSAYIQEDGAALPLEASPYDQAAWARGRTCCPCCIVQTGCWCWASRDREDSGIGATGLGSFVIDRNRWFLLLIPLFKYEGKPLAIGCG